MSFRAYNGAVNTSRRRLALCGLVVLIVIMLGVRLADSGLQLVEANTGVPSLWQP